MLNSHGYPWHGQPSHPIFLVCHLLKGKYCLAVLAIWSSAYVRIEFVQVMVGVGQLVCYRVLAKPVVDLHHCMWP